jgi:hypothetical protein
LEYVLILHELLLPDVRKYQKWTLTQERVKVGFTGNSDILLPPLTIMEGHVQLDAFFILRFQRRTGHWELELPYENCSQVCRDHRAQTHVRTIREGNDTFSICLGCGRPTECCQNPEHPDFRFTIEKDVRQTVERVTTRNWDYRPLPSWYEEFNSQQPDTLMKEWIPANHEKIRFMLAKYTLYYFPENIGKWYSWRLLHLVDFDFLVRVHAPPKPPSNTAELIFYYALFRERWVMEVHSKHPRDLASLPGPVRAKELVQLSWHITNENHDIGYDLSTIQFDQYTRTLSCTWASDNPQIRPRPIDGSDLRLLFRQLGGLQRLHMGVPISPDAWRLTDGTLDILSYLTLCYLIFNSEIDHNYPDLTYFRSAEELTFVTRESNEDAFWEWINTSRARLTRVHTLKLGSQKYNRHRIGGTTHWIGVASSFPMILTIHLNFRQPPDNRDEYQELRKDLEVAWPYTSVRITDPEGSG